MSLALITTTVNIPKVLELYRAYGSYVVMFVAGDARTPKQTIDFCKTVNARYLSMEEQHDLYPELSERIGRNTIARRNIALLEALKTGWQVIVTIDDDNWPMDRDYFAHFGQIFRWPFTGLQVQGGYSRWFDVGRLLDPVAPHRGFPLEVPSTYEIAHVIQAKIGVAAGICFGDPDISAITRIANRPIVAHGSALLTAGIAVAPDTWTVFNSQNTAFIRALAPCFLMLPQVGRYDDILASIIAQKIMRSLGLQVHFGKPFVWQQRNSHNLIKDLQAEIWGYANIFSIAGTIDRTILPEGTIIEQLRNLWRVIQPQLPDGSLALANTWLDTCEAIA